MPESGAGVVGRVRARSCPQGPLPDRRTLFLSWGAVAGRSAEIADALGGTALACLPPRAKWRPAPPLRWLLSAWVTSLVLLLRRPRRLIVTNPPVFPGIIALLYARLTGATVVLDDHPGSFGAQGDRVAARLMPVHRRMVPLAAACLVTAEHWADVVERWGGRALILHEAPGTWGLRPLPAAPGLTRLLYVCTFGGDEPVEEVLDAARSLPSLEVHVTGDSRKFPEKLRALVPPNVTLTGLLPFPEYRDAVYASDAVMALSTEPTSAMRAAFEAVWAGRPLVVSDWPLMAELFPEAIRVRNDAEGIVAGVRELAESYAGRIGHLVDSRVRQERRWENQLAELRHVLGLTRPEEVG